jgi:hypothetical protein
MIKGCAASRMLVTVGNAHETRGSITCCGGMTTDVMTELTCCGGMRRSGMGGHLGTGITVLIGDVIP